jgi:hypothetical protein
MDTKNATELNANVPSPASPGSAIKVSRREVAEMKRRQKEETQCAEERFRAMMRAGCHDCRRAAAHAMRIWDDPATPGKMVALCRECADKRVTTETVKGIEEDRPYEPEGVFVEYSPNSPLHDKSSIGKENQRRAAHD